MVIANSESEDDYVNFLLRKKSSFKEQGKQHRSNSYDEVDGDDESENPQP